jgi:hypothetical protein
MVDEQILDCYQRAGVPLAGLRRARVTLGGLPVWTVHPAATQAGAVRLLGSAARRPRPDRAVAVSGRPRPKRGGSPGDLRAPL